MEINYSIRPCWIWSDYSPHLNLTCQWTWVKWELGSSESSRENKEAKRSETYLSRIVLTKHFSNSNSEWTAKTSLFRFLNFRWWHEGDSPLSHNATRQTGGTSLRLWRRRVSSIILLPGDWEDCGYYAWGTTRQLVSFVHFFPSHSRGELPSELLKPALRFHHSVEKLCELIYAWVAVGIPELNWILVYLCSSKTYLI